MLTFLQSKRMKISFCTTCMNRAHHLKVTLMQNLNNTVDWSKPQDFEFVVLNYSSQDDLHDWITKAPELKPYRDAGVLIYARYDGAHNFRHSHAKNMAHKIASGDFVCNVDADNLMGQGFGAYLQKSFQENPYALICANISDQSLNRPPYIGCMGRVAISRQGFMHIGGYNENPRFNGWSGEDTDLIVRAVKNGHRLKFIQDKDFLHALAHSNDERIANTDFVNKGHELARIERLARPGLIGWFHRASFMGEMMLRPSFANRGHEIGGGIVEIISPPSPLDGLCDRSRAFLVR
jgi:glycosyltransferase involved in cell wall biosynthesis